MADLNISVLVSRLETSPTAPDLELEQTGKYEIVGMGPGDTVWEREEVTSLWVHGATLVSARKGMQAAPMVVRVKGNTHAEVDTRINDVLRAFEQFSYTMAVTINGISRTWRCQPADVSVGESGQWQPYHLMSVQQEVTLVIPRHPLTAAGTY